MIVDPIIKASMESIKAEYVKQNKRVADKLEHIDYVEKDSDEEEVQVKGTSFRDNLPPVNALGSNHWVQMKRFVALVGSKKNVDDDSKQNAGRENSSATHQIISERCSSCSAYLPGVAGDPQSQARQTDKRKFSLTNPANQHNLHQKSNTPAAPVSPGNHLAAVSAKQSSDDKGERSVVAASQKIEKNMLQSFGQIALGFLRREPSLILCDCCARVWILHKQGSAILSEKDRPAKAEKHPVKVYARQAREHVAKDPKAQSLLGKAVFAYKMKHAGTECVGPQHLLQVVVGRHPVPADVAPVRLRVDVLQRAVLERVRLQVRTQLREVAVR